jgi:hypothetical protein
MRSEGLPHRAGARRTIEDLATTLPESASDSFSAVESQGLPEPARRYLAAAIRPGTPLARSARIEMRGHIKIGRWIPFRAREIITPQRGFLWQARAAGLISGYDYYTDGHGGMDWKLARLIRVAHAEGPDVSRAAAERAGAEAIWLPTALLPRFGVEWRAIDDTHLEAHLDVDGHPVDVHYEIDDHGRITSLVFDRWHEPETGTAWSAVPCGGTVTAYRTFDGLTIPSAGNFGWFYGTDRWPIGEFFRYEITALAPVVVP